jgi:hypothetical protein
VIWLSWRLQRSELMIVAGVLALAAAALVPTGIHMASVFSSTGVGACLTHSSPGCGDTVNSFQQRFGNLENLVGWLNLLPGIAGALIAAPLVLDLEQGTFRLAWTQSISRNRWLATRLLVIVATAVAVGLVLIGLITWWRGPLDSLDGRMGSGFDFEGIVPIAYTLFAVGLVLAVGVVTRRIATALGVGIVGYLALRVWVAGWLRSRYMAPIHRSWTNGSGPDLHGALVINQTNRLQLPSGHAVDPGNLQACFSLGKRAPSDACLAAHHVTRVSSVVYQPASRFWSFQLIEASLFAGLAVALVAFSAYWIRGRIA